LDIDPGWDDALVMACCSPSATLAGFHLTVAFIAFTPRLFRMYNNQPDNQKRQ